MTENAFPWSSLPLSEFTSSDNTTLFYHHQPAIEPRGSIVITLAWTMSPDVCSPLLLTNTLIRQHYNVYIFIVRGYQTNSTFGNSVDRCAIDLQEFINHCKIGNFIAMGHSIGVALWWQYMLTYGQSRISKFVLLDEMTVLLQNPTNTPDQNLDYGSIVPLNDLFDAYNLLIKGDNSARQFRAGQIKLQFSDDFHTEHPDIFALVLEKVNRYSLASTAQILFSNQTNNWIDKLLNHQIDIPTYLFCGQNSVVPYQSVFYQQQFYINSRIHVFSGPSSSHFAWVENYAEFNTLLNNFIFN
jgi:pimeloyl-ACP methyl ester carboxylesterase